MYFFKEHSPSQPPAQQLPDDKDEAKIIADISVGRKSVTIPCFVTITRDDDDFQAAMKNSIAELDGLVIDHPHLGAMHFTPIIPERNENEVVCPMVLAANLPKGQTLTPPQLTKFCMSISEQLTLSMQDNGISLSVLWPTASPLTEDDIFEEA